MAQSASLHHTFPPSLIYTASSGVAPEGPDDDNVVVTTWAWRTGINGLFASATLIANQARSGPNPGLPGLTVNQLQLGSSRFASPCRVGCPQLRGETCMTIMPRPAECRCAAKACGDKSAASARGDGAR
jgi:hypothetical protein